MVINASMGSTCYLSLTCRVISNFPSIPRGVNFLFVSITFSVNIRLPWIISFGLPNMPLVDN